MKFISASFLESSLHTLHYFHSNKNRVKHIIHYFKINSFLINLYMKRRQSSRQPQKKQQRVVHKGIYISNERRKGPGGRIKCDKFECKIQVNDFNSAIHESQVEWVQIRRYTKGQKRQRNDRKDKSRNEPKPNDKKKNTKFVEAPQKIQSSKKQQNQQQRPTEGQKKQEVRNLYKKFKQKQQNDKKQIAQQQPKNQSLKSEDNSKSEDLKSPQVQLKQKDSNSNSEQKQLKDSQLKNQQVRNKQDDDTQSQGQQEQRQLNEPDYVELTQTKIQQTVVIKESATETVAQSKTQEKTQSTQTKKVQQTGAKKQQTEKKQQVIVARIIKQTKIVYQQKKFVGILTCEKKKGEKNSFIQKDIKPIQKICDDYYLDVSPIHSRLPKMQVDTLVKSNLGVLTEYIEKTHPQKGNELTKRKLNQILDILQSIYVVASFGLWQKDRPYANIHQVIGKTTTIDGECNCFLFEHHLNDFHYSQLDTEKQLEKLVEFKPTEYHKNFDKMVFSIDPATSVDLDDALSIQKKTEDTYEIGIHISDVSQYLKYIERSELIKRTTSVYLPHKVFHMLTPELMKISSLNPNVERLAFSIYVVMNLKGQIVEPSRIQKNVIKSRFKLSYETVQDIITGKITFDDFLIKHPNTEASQFDTLVEKLQMLTKIGLAHRSKRVQFQVFQNRQIHFELDEQRWPIDISVQSRFTSKKIVEQYMIIGNVEAASHLIKNYRENALIIYHPKPSDLAIKNFNETFKFLNKTFSFDDIEQVQNQFLEIQNDKSINEEIKQYLYFKGRRMQESAGYKLYHDAVKQIIEKDGQKPEKQLRNVHFALGQDFYTHFTSPMRRMADILVHETLNSLIYKTEPKIISQEQIEQINLGRKHTKRLKKDLTQIYMCLMIFKTGKKIQQEGIVTSYGLKSVSIYIPYFDMMKQIMWRDELQIDRVTKNKQNEQILDVCIYYDRKYPSKDIYWKVQKYDKVKLIIDCTKKPPLRLAISLEVTTTKGNKQLIRAYFPDY